MSVEFCETTPTLAWSMSRRNPCTDARPTETCVAPVDASRDFIYFFIFLFCFLLRIYFFSERAVWGVGGVCCQTLLFCSLFPVQQTTCVCVCVFFPFILDIKFVGHTSRGHTGFFIHLPSAVRALIFLARRIQSFLSLVDREVEFCVLTI